MNAELYVVGAMLITTRPRSRAWTQRASAIASRRASWVCYEKYGEQIAAVIPKRGTSPTAEEIQDFCAENIARFKVPYTIPLC